MGDDAAGGEVDGEEVGAAGGVGLDGGEARAGEGLARGPGEDEGLFRFDEGEGVDGWEGGGRGEGGVGGEDGLDGGDFVVSEGVEWVSWGLGVKGG